MEICYFYRIFGDQIQHHNVLRNISNQGFKHLQLATIPKNLHLVDTAFKILKTYLVKLVFINPLPCVEIEPTIQSPKEHIARLHS